MSKVFASATARMWLVVAALVIFAVVGAVLIFGNQGPAPQHRTFLLQVAGNTMSPGQLQAYEGDTLSISVVADRAEEIHLHGYDKHFFTAPGQPVTLTFPGDRTGSFVMEIEATSSPLGTLQVQPRGGLFRMGKPRDQSSTTVVQNQFAGIIQIGSTRSYNLSLQVGPLQPMYAPEDLKTQHPKSGEVMFAGQMVMPPASNASPDWRHLEVHFFDKASGDVVRSVSPTITITNGTTGQVQNVPVTTMQGLAEGPGDFHFGNNVELPRGRYLVTVQVGSEITNFDIAV